MITGFNTDVEHGGRVFHVQTEDKGLSNPVVETLVYTKGEILTSRRTSYEELAESGRFSEEEVLARMEAQHQALIREICHGKFTDGGTPKPFGHNIISNRSLDEVALDWLTETVALEPIRLQLLDQQILYEGTRPALRLQVLEDGSERPVGGAEVRIKLISTRDEPRELFAARTDREGFLEAAFEIPAIPGEESAILCEVELLGRRAHYRQLVEKAKRAS